MADNKQIKDGLGNIFTIRMRDISAGADGSFQRSMILSTPFPLDYGSGGNFQASVQPAADLQPGMVAAPIYSFLWGSSALQAVIQRVTMAAWTTGTGFTAGLAQFSLFAARQYTAQATGGNAVNFANDSNKLATVMAPPVANIVYAASTALTPGTRTLDSNPLSLATVAAPIAANTPFSPAPLVLLDKRNDQPLLLAVAEGFVVQATVPAAGSWRFSLALEWAEVSKF
jgi:hypothetical protein